MGILVEPKMTTVPESLTEFSLNNFSSLEFDDPYISLLPVRVDYKSVGEKKEAEISARCEEHGFVCARQEYGESKDLDRFLIPKDNPLISIPVQIRSAAYKETADVFMVGTTCTKNGYRKASLDPTRVSFVLVWMPFTFKDTFSRRRGIYIIPIELFNLFKRNLTIFPHREPSNTGRGNMKVPNMNEYFEAWHLLEKYKNNLAEGE